MKALLITMISLFAMLTASAQDSAVLSLFDGRYRENPKATESVMKSTPRLKKLGLTYYHGVTLVNSPEEIKAIEDAISSDSKIAVESQSVNKNGALYFSLLTLPKVKGVNRYVIYLNRLPEGKSKTILIYLEGNASTEKVKSLLKQE